MTDPWNAAIEAAAQICAARAADWHAYRDHWPIRDEARAIGEAIRALARPLEPPREGALVETVARLIVKWTAFDDNDEPVSPDASLGGDGQNLRWHEEREFAQEIIAAVKAALPPSPAKEQKP